MNHSTYHCNLCGKTTEATRNNGWNGSAFLTLKWDGNGASKNYEQIHLCFDCGKSVHEKLESLKKSFKLKTVIEFTEPNEES